MPWFVYNGYIMNKVDKQILDGLVAGLPESVIAASLDIPLEWVSEFAEYYSPEVALIDLPKIYGMN